MDKKTDDRKKEVREGPEVETERHASTEKKVTMATPAARGAERTGVGWEETAPVEHARPAARTWWPTVGGILELIAGVLNLLAGLGISISGGFIGGLYGYAGLEAAGIPFMVLGILSIVGGVFALQRRVWWLALIGGIAAAFPSPVWIIGIPALIFVSLAKPEFR